MYQKASSQYAFYWTGGDVLSLVRKRDKSYIAFAKKFIEDALVNNGILHDDGWNEIESFKDEFRVDKHNACVKVEIWLQRTDI